MFRKSLTLMAALGIAAVNPRSVQADLCFHYPNHEFGALGGTLVAKGARLPAENTCESLTMYEVNGPDGTMEGFATGVLCRNAPDKVAGNPAPRLSLFFVYNACLGPGKFEAVTCQLEPSGGAGQVTLPTTRSSCRGLLGTLFFSDQLVHTYIAGPGTANDGVLDSCRNVNTDLVINETFDCRLGGGNK
jgi:hypothetical protein